MRRARFIVQGQVQGVGFRPFVFTLAHEEGLTGFVRNSPRGVVIEAQGPAESLERFAHALVHRLPPLARITGMQREAVSPVPGECAFAIEKSTAGDTHAVLISPDTSVCADCRADMADAAGRRHNYPFTNCTNCGPRYTITRSIPYDRAFTSMGCFPLCPDCQAEYDNPRNRRFHAQPNACPVCGPQVWFVQPAGQKDQNSLRTDLNAQSCTGENALWALAEFLTSGGIAAIKGLGGFHLACDACDDAAVRLLRERKSRPHKPFAVMAASLADARRIAHVGPEEEALLTSPEHPIVLCSLLPGVSAGATSSISANISPSISPNISPDTSSVGIMLPYTPLHQVLMKYMATCLRERHALLPTAPGAYSAALPRPVTLVMTSGNKGGEPICLGNREALANLGEMADAFLFHNRDILVRVDDSVVRPLPGRGTLFFRRARGYVPRPVHLAPLPAGEAVSPALPGEEHGTFPQKESEREHAAASVSVLGVGAELKNTLCLTKGDTAFVSQHIGDMANMETAAFHREIRGHLAELLKVSPALLVRDLHPNYLSSGMAEELGRESGIPVLALQHHYAHAHAVLAEHQHSGPALVLALDGTGLGEDGTLWGGEVLYVDTATLQHQRLAHLVPLPLPGGEAAIREPWRIAHALLLQLGLIGKDTQSGCETHDTDLPWLPEHAAAAALLPRILERRLNTPQSTSCGRLFDAVAAMLGLCNTTTYEGQAAIRLEEAQYADRKIPQGQNETQTGNAEVPACAGRAFATSSVLYPCSFGPSSVSEDSLCLQLDTHALFTAVHADKNSGIPVPEIARRFHASLAAALVAVAAHLAREHGIAHVGMSGGCLQNVTLALALAKGLEEQGLIPLLHKELPPGDGCISLGQAAWGRKQSCCHTFPSMFPQTA